MLKRGHAEHGDVASDMSHHHGKGIYFSRRLLRSEAAK
jgi:hypothetical protein